MDILNDKFKTIGDINKIAQKMKYYVVDYEDRLYYDETSESGEEDETD